jgi:hypothetical protein
MQMLHTLLSSSLAWPVHPPNLTVSYIPLVLNHKSKNDYVNIGLIIASIDFSGRNITSSPLLLPATYKGSSRDSAVGMATGYGLDSSEVGVRVLAGARFFSAPRRPDRY